MPFLKPVTVKQDTGKKETGRGLRPFELGSWG